MDNNNPSLLENQNTQNVESTEQQQGSLSSEQDSGVKEVENRVSVQESSTTTSKQEPKIINKESIIIKDNNSVDAKTTEGSSVVESGVKSEVVDEELLKVEGQAQPAPKIIKKGDRVIKEYVDEKTGRINVYEPGIKLEVSDFKGVWYPAKVLEVDRDENEVLVHYDKWSARFDEWIKCDSNRLRPTPSTNVVKIEFKVNEKVEAVWSTDGNRYPGVIHAVLPNDYYEIIFEDGIKCKKKASQIFKIQRVTRRASAALQKPGKGSTKIDDAGGTTLAGRGRQGSFTSSVAAMSKDTSLTRRRSTNLQTTSLATNSETSPAATTTEVLPTGAFPPPMFHYSGGPGSRHSIFDPISTDLGKRKRASHDYSLFLKIPKTPRKPRAGDSSESSPSAGGGGGEQGKPVRGRPKAKNINKTENLHSADSTPTKTSGVTTESDVNIEQSDGTLYSEGGDDVRTKSEDDHHDDATLTSDGRSKRNRKSSMKAIENIAAESEKTPRRKATALTRRGTSEILTPLSASEASSTVISPPQQQQQSSASSQAVECVEEPPQPEQNPGFVDAQGNIVAVEQTSDGGWICPVDKCAKHFRKESLLQMHLKHYHPETNIQYRGRKLMNVVESAFARAAYVYPETTPAPSTPAAVEKESLSASSFVSPPLATETSIPATKGRRKSSPVTNTTNAPTVVPHPSSLLHVESPEIVAKSSGSATAAAPDEDQMEVDESDEVSLDDEEDSSTDTASSSPEKSLEDETSPTVNVKVLKSEKGKFKTKNVRVVLEKINLTKLQNQVHSSSATVKAAPRPRVSQRGRTLPRRRWNRRFSDNSDEDSWDESEFLMSSGDEADDDSDKSPTKLSRQKTKKGGLLGHYQKQHKHGSSSRHRPSSSSLLSHKKKRRDTEIKPERAPASDDESAQQQQQDESLLSARQDEENDVVAVDASGGLLMPAAPKSRRGRKPGRRMFAQSKAWSGRGRPPKSSRESSSRADILTGYSRLQLKYIERQLYKNGQNRKLHFIPKSEDVYVDIINCECGHGEEFELMMQCELCQSWQHGPCYGIQEAKQMPQYYVCNFCRDPKRFRQGFSDEWSQEINKTGRLPRLSIAPRVSSSTEKKMKTCNDLMRRLEVVRDCLRSTQMKIELLNAPTENPKLYRWHKEVTAPWEDVRQYQFNRHFRGLIRRLLRQHQNDSEYVKQLRSRIENYHKTREVQGTQTEEEQIQGLVKKRLNARAWQMLNDMKKKEQIEELNNDDLNVVPQDDVTDELISVLSQVVSGFDSSTINQFDSASFPNSDHLVSLNSIFSNSVNGLVLNNNNDGGELTNIGQSADGHSEEAGTSKQMMEEEAIKKLKLELKTKIIEEHLPLFEPKNDNLSNVTPGKKYLLLAKDTGCGETVGDIVPVSQKCQPGDGQLDKKFVGTGTIVAKVNGLHVIRIIDDSVAQDHATDIDAKSTSSIAVNAEHLRQLKLCRPCKNNFNIKWNSKAFAREENVTLSGDSLRQPADKTSSLLTSETQPSIPMDTTTSIQLNNNISDLVLDNGSSKKQNIPTSMESAQVSGPGGDLENPEVQFELTSDEEEDEDSSTLSSMPKRITAESCRAHLHADIVKQQAMLDFHLDMIEEKLKSLESNKPTDPNSVIRKLKDLEELKRKVQRINANISFMTKIQTSKETEVPQT